ncbi:uncharacterized protein LOC126809167 [Patella vulgata]|uniref:uncharacterized protein LOC126809167 n=1 Tax=Patella vulgata TaxID=6465 RepID=UPI0024A7CB6F|nr:uncharacterized protein LOC126809167 [Patella vulgata]
MGFQNSPQTNYTCKCQIEQAEVNTLGGDRSPWVRIWTAVGVAIMVLFIACNITLILWMKTAQEAYIANNIYLENIVNQLNADIKKVAAEQDCDDDLGDQEEDAGYILRTARGTQPKNKNGRNKRHRRKSKRSRCKCQKEIKAVENMLTKTKRSTTNRRPATHLRGLNTTTGAQQPATASDGKFLWNSPERTYASQFIYNKNADDKVHSILITTPGLYEIYSQVALYGTKADVVDRECGQEIIKSSGGQTTTLAKSFITQVFERTGHTNQNPNSVSNPLDTSFQKGIFALEAYDEVYVKKNCNHMDFISHPAYTYFGVLLLVDYSNK